MRHSAVTLRAHWRDDTANTFGKTAHLHVDLTPRLGRSLSYCTPGAYDFGHTPPTQNKATDPMRESAATTIAAAGHPPEPRERGGCDSGTGRPARKTRRPDGALQNEPASGHARTCCAGTSSERDARLDTARGAAVSGTCWMSAGLKPWAGWSVTCRSSHARRAEGRSE